MQTLPRNPIFFGKAPLSVVGPDAPIRIDPAVSSQADWEVELALIIGRPGRDISPAAAPDHVLGYTIANDVSARDLQMRDGGQWYQGKSLDSFCPLGPWIVSTDEFGDASALELSLRVNDAEKQRGNTRDLLFDIRSIIAELSRGRTIEAGTIILTGTPSGVGFTRTPPEFLRPGDVVEAEISGIGVLRSPVVGSGVSPAT